MTILVSVDFSSVTKPVLDVIPDMIKENEMVKLIHVVPPPPSFVGFDTAPSAVQVQVGDEIEKAQRKLEGLCQQLKNKGINVETELLQGVIANTIMNYAKKEQVRLVVLGSHGHGALYDILVGSVAEQILKDTNLPVLLVPSSK